MCLVNRYVEVVPASHTARFLLCDDGPHARCEKKKGLEPKSVGSKSKSRFWVGLGLVGVLVVFLATWANGNRYVNLF